MVDGGQTFVGYFFYYTPPQAQVGAFIWRLFYLCKEPAVRGTPSLVGSGHFSVVQVEAPDLSRGSRG
ncbi:MAG TPA: hypothetical protein VJT08_09920, partial [Terriglobales bacterium]|nr:hypothetical protein [Terriglobales bacterium]